MLKLKVHVLMELVSLSSLLFLYLLTTVYLEKKTTTYAQVCGKLQVASFTGNVEGLKRTIVSELLRKRYRNCSKKSNVVLSNSILNLKWVYFQTVPLCLYGWVSFW